MKHPLSPLAILWLSTAPMMAGAQVLDLDEITVSANLTPTEISRSGSAVSTLEADDLHDATSPSLLGTLDSLPGVSVVQNGPMGTSATVNVRGLGSEYIAVRIDGIDVSDPSATQAGFNDFGGLSGMVFNRAELLRGAQSALYGGTAAAGVLTLETLGLETAPEGLRYDVALEAGSHDTASAGFNMTQSEGPLTLAMAISKVRSAGFSAADESAGNTEADGFSRERLALGAAYDLAPGLTIGANAFRRLSESEFDEYGATPQDGTPDETSAAAETGARIFLNSDIGAWRNAGQLSYYQIDRASVSPTVSGFAETFESAFRGERTQFNYTLSRDFGAAWKLSLGADATRDKVRSTTIPGGSATLDQHGVFAELIYSPSDRLDVTGTLRHDQHSSFGGFNTGRLTVAYRPDTETVLRGMISSGYRPPSTNELFAFYPGNYPTRGNPNLQPETNDAVEIGVDRFFGRGGKLSATVFHQEFDNEIRYSSCPLTANFSGCQPGTQSTYENESGKTLRQGLELAATVPLSQRLTLDGSYTLLDTADPQGDRLTGLPRHDLSLGLSVDTGAQTTARLSLQHVADRIDRQGPMPDYTVVGMSVTHQLSDQTEAYLRVDNLFDEDYQTIRGYGTSGRAAYFGVRASF
ncbi:TonB-dependent receptor plug domain-containing protein [Sediminimonas qiaohouensis]|uniref:TonB-dependent receptor plug domain-containing protein n=1 Tax=Sediminimonas qiaohouensis TaxID=552061 RepID=UPI00040A06C3|nr:TonB-dependent receptor [Sediminimonas qiaohouensis]